MSNQSTTKNPTIAKHIKVEKATYETNDREGYLAVITEDWEWHRDAHKSYCHAKKGIPFFVDKYFPNGLTQEDIDKYLSYQKHFSQKYIRTLNSLKGVPCIAFYAYCWSSWQFWPMFKVAELTKVKMIDHKLYGYEFIQDETYPTKE